MLDDAVYAVLAAYPTIHSACRRREVRLSTGGRRLSDHQAGILDHLDPVAPITVGDLAGTLRVTPATVSLQLDRLARLRLVTRERDERDGRRVQLRLTEAGARVRGGRSLLDPDRVRAALARLPSGEQDAVVSGMRLLARVSAELPREGGTPRRRSRSPRRPPTR